MIRTHFTQWLSELDQEQLDALTNRKVWIVILLTLLAIIALASAVPWISDFFRMQAITPLICLIPVVICAVLVSSSRLRQRCSSTQYGVLIMTTSAVFQLFMWSLVCASTMPGATLMAALPVLLAAYHGEFFLFSRKYPWAALTTVPAALGAWLQSPSQEHDIVILVGTVIALGAAFTMGNHALLRVQATRERNALKAAIDAQTLLDSVREMEQTQDLLNELRGTNHDAGNALSGILMNLDLLCASLDSRTFDTRQIPALGQMAADIATSTARLRALIEKGREMGKQAQQREALDLKEVAQAVIKEVQSIFPEVDFILQCEGIDLHRQAHLHGGPLTLHRILGNLLKNAAEGNGNQRATRVELSLRANADEIALEVRDNGPGFAAEYLNNRLSNIATSKSQGSGLGLYTTQRLIIANHGQFKLANREHGGARVLVNLPRDAQHER